jgi:hypothetical protein
MSAQPPARRGDGARQFWTGAATTGSPETSLVGRAIPVPAAAHVASSRHESVATQPPACGNRGPAREAPNDPALRGATRKSVRDLPGRTHDDPRCKPPRPQRQRRRAALYSDEAGP